MYLIKKEYFNEIVDLVRICRKVIEKVFYKELEYEFGKVEDILNILKNEVSISYHKSIELDIITKIFFKYRNKVTLFNKDNRRKFEKMLDVILKYRNEVSHNDLKTDNLNKHLILVHECLILDELKPYVKESYINYVINLINKTQ